MSRPARFHQENWPYFVTSATLGRQPTFADPQNAEAFVEALYASREKYSFLIQAYVVMPDHFHGLIVPAPRNTISQVMRFIKGTYARSHNVNYGLAGSVWQPSFYDRIVRNDGAFEDTLAYICQNPVRAGLVSTPEEYRFSSAYPGRQTDLETYLLGQAECLPYGSTRTTTAEDGSPRE